MSGTWKRNVVVVVNFFWEINHEEIFPLLQVVACSIILKGKTFKMVPVVSDYSTLIMMKANWLGFVHNQIDGKTKIIKNSSNRIIWIEFEPFIQNVQVYSVHLEMRKIVCIRCLSSGGRRTKVQRFSGDAVFEREKEILEGARPVWLILC